MVQMKERSEDDRRKIVLGYLHNRYWNGKSERGEKTGRAVKIMRMRRDLKESHGLKAEEVQRALFYLMEHGLVTKIVVKKMFLPKGQTMVEQETNFYQITAEGVDRFNGPSEFTPESVPAVQIGTLNAHGSAVAFGSNNRVSSHLSDVSAALANLKREVSALETQHEDQRRDMLLDIDMLHREIERVESDSLLANHLWQRVERIGKLLGVASSVATVAAAIAPYLHQMTS